MRPTDIEARRAEIIREHGPWTSNNLDLGGGVYTIGPATDAMAEQRIARIVQAVSDAAPKPLSDLRVLDLACYEGGFGIAFAQRGAEVLGIETRTEHVVKSRFAASALDLDNISFEQADVRELSRDRYGGFDAVLCLGILYHLDAPDCFDLLRQVFDVCDGLAVIETQIALSRPRREAWQGHEYRGRSYPENTAQPGASRDNLESFWLSRPSLLNAVGDVGFTSVSELLSPVIPELAAFRDHITLLAWKGGRISETERWPERLLTVAHPTQGLSYRLLDRAVRLRGHGIQSVFPKR